MFGTTFIDWLVSLAIAHNTWQVWRVWHRPVRKLVSGEPRTPLQHRAITVSVVCNLIALGSFKYFNFGLETYNEIVRTISLDHLQWETFFRVVMRIVISIYTFQALSYTIDVYRSASKAIAN